MSVNSELHYLLSGLHLDSNNVQIAEKRADLPSSVNAALQAYSEQNISFSVNEPKHCFCNEPTYRINNGNAEVVPWQECFTEQQLLDIQAFCTKNDLVI